MRTPKTIYSKRNPQLQKIFERTEPVKIMCIALDYAKAQHTVLICDGRGDILKDCFAVDNSAAGAKLLLDQARACAKHKKVQSEDTFFVGEDCPSYAENFIRRLRSANYLILHVNAWEAKQQRDNYQASSDALDLLGIARCCLNRHAYTLEDAPEAYSNLRIATRDRDKVVRLRTLVSNRMHGYVDRLFPGFLEIQKSGLSPFGQASLELMEERFSPAQMGRRRRQTLIPWLRRRRVKEPEEVAAKLKKLATETLEPAPPQTAMLQRTLAKLVRLYRDLQQSISALDKEVAHWLARTPGAFLTSIGGFGVILAAGWTAELGPPSQWRPTRRISSYAGVVPKTKQTGGPDKEPLTGKVQQRCNKRLKNVVLQAVEKVRQYGPEDLRQAAQQLDLRGAHTQYAMAKRLIRLCKHLVVNQTIYRPKALINPQTPQTTLADHYQAIWEKLLPKWRAKADLHDVFAPDLPLGQWRNMARELYGLQLPLCCQQPSQDFDQETL
jgi:transposase